MKNTLISAGVAAVVVILAFAFFAPKPNVITQVLGAVPGGDFTNVVNFQGGVLNSGLVATTSMGASITLTAAELMKWADASVVEFKPGLMAITTITLPASSTVPSLVPKAGDRKTFCIRNATTTALRTVVIAGSTGINLNVASSSVTALGSDQIQTGEIGCVTLVRESATGSTFDIDALLTVYK